MGGGRRHHIQKHGLHDTVCMAMLASASLELLANHVHKHCPPECKAKPTASESLWTLGMGGHGRTSKDIDGRRRTWEDMARSGLKGHWRTWEDLGGHGKIKHWRTLGDMGGHQRTRADLGGHEKVGHWRTLERENIDGHVRTLEDVEPHGRIQERRIIDNK